MSTKSQTVFAVCFGLFLAVVVTVSLLFADIETQDDGSVVPVEYEVVKTYLYVDTIPLTAAEAAEKYGLDEKQRKQLDELLSDRNKELWEGLLS